MSYDCDLLILGSGSTAFAAALRARELGKTAIMTEERTIGGTCVTRGCLPSKNLIEAARLLHEARHPRYPGLLSRGMDLDFRALVQQKDALVQDYRAKKYASLTGDGIRIEEGHAELVDPHTVSVDGRHVTGAAVLIATGSRPVIPAVSGLSEVPYSTSDLLTVGEAMELEDLPRTLLVVGGGYIALELGQTFSRLGSKVVVLERSAELLTRNYEPEVGPTIRTLLAQEGLDIVTGAEAKSVVPDGQGLRLEALVRGERRSFEVEHLLVATGRRPNTDAIGIERAGVELDGGGFVRVDDWLRTNVSHVFAAGDVIGRSAASQMATPVGSQDGGIAALNALSGEEPRRVDHRVIPRVIFTDPPIAVVGVTEEEAIAAGHRCWCNTLPLSLVPRAGAIRDTRGIVKMVADAQTDEVLGVTMIGHGAGEVIHEAAMALRFRAKLRDFIELVHVYPTMAEALKIIAISRYKDPSKLSCCAE